MGYVTNRRYLEMKDTERLLQYIFGGDLGEYSQKENRNFVDFIVGSNYERRDCCALKDATIREIFSYCGITLGEEMVTLNGAILSENEKDCEIINLSMLDDAENFLMVVIKNGR